VTGVRSPGKARRIDVAESFTLGFKGRAAAACAFAALGAVLAASCSNTPRNPERAARTLVRAHGGERRIERLGTFTGKGFIRDLADTVVAKSNAFDLYRSGERYKHVMTRTSAGKLDDVIIHWHNAEGTWEWSSRSQLRSVSPMEFGLLRFRYPLVLSWIREQGRTPESLEAGAGDRQFRLRYRHEDMLLTLVIDRSSRLLDGVEIRSTADTTFLFTERYGNYMDLDGTPFPQRYAATHRGKPLYEYLLSRVEIRSDLPDSLFAPARADTARNVR
jgi:hypothetical protein